MQTDADRAQDVIAEWLARRANASAGQAVSGQRVTFVFRPGGVPGGNVYADWPTMLTAMAAVQGPRFVQIDGSIATPTVPAGNWNVDGVTFTASTPFNSSASALFFADGAHLTFNTIRLAQGVVFATTAATTPVATLINGAHIWLDQSSFIASESPAAPLFHVPAGAIVFFEVENSAIGDGVAASVIVDAGGTCVFDTFSQSSIAPNALTGTGTADVNLSDDSTVGTPQAVTTLNITLISVAKAVRYTPATSGNWGTTPPVNAAAALDDLAALLAAHAWADSGVQVTLTTTAATIVAHASITPRVSGKIRVIVSGTINNTGAATSLILSLGHGGSATPADFTQGTQSVAGGSLSTGQSIVYEYTSAFPLNTPIEIDAVLQAGTANVVVVPAHGIQIDLQEVN